MSVDILTVTLIGILLCTVTAVILGLAGRRFPSAERYSLRVWTVALALQPLAWSMFALRGNLPDFVLSITANFLLVLGYSEMARAVRIFLAVPQRRSWLWANAVLVAIGIWLVSGIPYSFSKIVLLNCCGCGFALLIMLWPLRIAFKSGGSVPERIMAVVVVVGLCILSLRFAEHLLRPMLSFGFTSPTFPDSLAVMYAAFAPVIVSFGFLLMHQERAYTMLERLASVDSLTGILNRRAIEAQVQSAFARTDKNAQAPCLLLIDLDHFKQINDQHGHSAGDIVLRQSAQRILKLLPEGDLVGRVGGEELLVLRRNVEPVSAHQPRNVASSIAFAELIRTALNAPILHEGKQLQVSASIGVADRQNSEPFEATVKRADAAMYASKHSGRNRSTLG